MNAARLYTPEVLALATDLARWPLADALVMRGSARSASCGSVLTLGLRCDPAGRIVQVGIAANACAIGQAAAAVFAGGAVGHNAGEIAAAENAITGWLAGGDMPDWPGLAAIAPARDYPARHGAILLGWRAALGALATPALPG